MKKAFVALTALLFLTGAGCVGNSDQSASIPVGQNRTNSKTANQPATPPAAVTETTAAKIVSPSAEGRGAFDSLISPDGMWLLKEGDVEKTGFEWIEKEERYSNQSFDHKLILKGLFGQGEKVIFSSHEEMTGDWQPIKGIPFPSNWQLAGWSADGTKVYFVSKGVTEGCGGDYPNQFFAGVTLHEVSVSGGQEKITLKVVGGVCGYYVGIRDVYATKNMVLFEEFEEDVSPAGESTKYNIYLADLKGTKKLVATTVGNGGFTANVINPNGKYFATVIPESGYAPRKYTLFIRDVSGKVIKTEDVTFDESKTGFASVRWLNDKMLRVEMINGAKKDYSL